MKLYNYDWKWVKKEITPRSCVCWCVCLIVWGVSNKINWKIHSAIYNNVWFSMEKLMWIKVSMRNIAWQNEYVGLGMVGPYTSISSQHLLGHVTVTWCWIQKYHVYHGKNCWLIDDKHLMTLVDYLSTIWF